MVLIKGKTVWHPCPWCQKSSSWRRELDSNYASTSAFDLCKSFWVSESTHSSISQLHQWQLSWVLFPTTRKVFTIQTHTFAIQASTATLFDCRVISYNLSLRTCWYESLRSDMASLSVRQDNIPLCTIRTKEFYSPQSLSLYQAECGC